MPFQCEWKIPGKVLYANVGPDLCLDEVRLLSQVAVQHVVDAGDPPVYFIVDITTLRGAPGQISQLHRIAGDAVSQQIGCYIIIVSNQIFAFVAATFIKLLRRPVRIVSSSAEAITSLGEFDPQLAGVLRL